MGHDSIQELKETSYRRCPQKQNLQRIPGCRGHHTSIPKPPTTASEQGHRGRFWGFGPHSSLTEHSSSPRDSASLGRTHPSSKVSSSLISVRTKGDGALNPWLTGCTPEQQSMQTLTVQQHPQTMPSEGFLPQRPALRRAPNWGLVTQSPGAMLCRCLTCSATHQPLHTCKCDLGITQPCHRFLSKFCSLLPLIPLNNEFLSPN